MIRNLIIVCMFVPVSAQAAVYISEIAWMGGEGNANAEWVELYSDTPTDLSGWILQALDGSPTITLSGTLSGAGVLERGEGALPQQSFLTYTGSLSNGGEILVLLNKDEIEVDRVDGSDGWSRIGGDNGTKHTAQKVSGVWKTLPATPGSAQTTEEVSTPITEESAPTVSAAAPQPYLILDVEGEMEVPAQSEAEFSAILKRSDGIKYFDARIEWNFGDGVVRSGQRIYHKYHHPGVYVATVRGSYGSEQASKRVRVHVYEPNVSLSVIRDDLISLTNTGNIEVDISRWRIEDGGRVFILPQDSVLLPKGSTYISAQTTRFLFSENTLLRLAGGDALPATVEKSSITPPQVSERIVYIEKEAEKEILEEVSTSSPLVAAPIASSNPKNGVSPWIYAWVVLILVVGGSIVFIRRYG